MSGEYNMGNRRDTGSRHEYAEVSLSEPNSPAAMAHGGQPSLAAPRSSRGYTEIKLDDLEDLDSLSRRGAMAVDDNELSSEDPTAQSSAAPSRSTSPIGIAARRHKGKARVRFNNNSEVNDETNNRSSLPLVDKPESPLLHSPLQLPKYTKVPSTHARNGSNHLIRFTPEHEKGNPFADIAADHLKGPASPALKKPRPSLLRNNSANSMTGDFLTLEEEEEDNHSKIFSALAAQERAQRVATLLGSHSAPTSRRGSLGDEDNRPVITDAGTALPVRIDEVALVKTGRQKYEGTMDDSEDEFHNEKQAIRSSNTSEAHKLVRAHTQKYSSKNLHTRTDRSTGLVSGQVTPTDDVDMEDYVSRPDQYRGGVLSSLLKLYNAPGQTNGTSSRRGSDSGFHTPTGSSGTATPVTKIKNPKWYNQKNQSKDTLANLIEASAMLSSPAGGAAGGNAGSRPHSIRPHTKRSRSAQLFEHTMGRMSRPILEDEIRITVHIAETLSRQKYLIRLCRALMCYGAPTHRLEEYMKMSARVLEIDGQFLYIPGCMLVSFDDASTHTTEVKLVRSAQGVDLGKLKEVHEIYKEVVHDVIGVEEATQRLDNVIGKKQKHNKWILVMVYGLASATVGPFAFEARLIDLPICFILGSLLGFMQLVLAPRSDLYSNVFEVSAAVLTSFLARAFGSISYNGSPLFCFSALAQSAIALILPGYMVLCGALELQSRSMVAGSVRMVYAIIYSLFLGFGITVGTAIYGLIDENATSATTCSNTMNQYYRFFFVPAFAMCLAVINQAKWKQTPIMILIAMAGYVVNFFSAKKFPSNAQISNTLGAFAVGSLGNLHSRLRHGVAAAAMLPAIFVQVPSGLAASGSLLAGLSQADAITNTTTYANGTSKISSTSSVTVTSSTDLNSIVFNVGYSMVQIAIGITVGLFLSALIVYPLGKRRSGLFSF